MAALAGITAVRPTANTITVPNAAYGATISAGNPVYKDPADNEWKLAGATSATLAAARGIAMTPGVDGGYGVVAIGGNIILVGTTMAVGEPYAVGATAGQIVPETDLASTNYVTRLGTAATTTQLNLSIQNTGIQHA